MGKPQIRLRPTPIVRKQIGFMRKLLGTWGSENNKNTTEVKRNPVPLAKEGVPIFLAQEKGKNLQHITRRQVMLNRHFTEIISDVLTNNLRSKFNDLGVRINSIETKSWNKGVSIYYYAQKEFDRDLHKKLNTFVYELRASVSERQLIGRAPQINFVYDKSADFDASLEKKLNLIKIDEPVEKMIVESQPKNSLQSSDLGLSEKEQTISENKFSAPKDMCNMGIGLDYVDLYNQTSFKLKRGRGESSRMLDNTSVAQTNPIFIDPVSKVDDDDSQIRINNMYKFLVSQRKKLQATSRKKRLQELIDRDNIKWEIYEPEDNSNHSDDKINNYQSDEFADQD